MEIACKIIKFYMCIDLEVHDLPIYNLYMINAKNYDDQYICWEYVVTFILCIIVMSEIMNIPQRQT